MRALVGGAVASPERGSFASRDLQHSELDEFNCSIMTLRVGKIVRGWWGEVLLGGRLVRRAWKLTDMQKILNQYLKVDLLTAAWGLGAVLKWILLSPGRDCV